MPLIGTFPTSNTASLPMPTSADAGKILMVNSAGQYVLVNAVTWFNTYIAPSVFNYDSSTNTLDIVTE